jgi:adenosylcobinamide-phosphate synthase
MLIPMLPLFAGGRMEALALLLAALLIDALIGDPPALWRRLPHPVMLIGRVIHFLDVKLNRESRSNVDRRLRGAVVALGMGSAALLLGALVTRLRLTTGWGWVVELVLIWTLIAQKSLFRHVRAVAAGLKQGGLMAGRWAVSRIVGRDPQSLDEYGVARAAIESCAENFADGVVAPVFWYVLLGFPGLLLYKTANTMDSMIGHRTERHLEFGMVAARLDDLLTLIPARLSGLLLVLAMAFAPGGQPVAAWRIMWRDHANHDSPNSGWPEAAMAGGLGLALAGPCRYGTELIEGKWIGDGRARAEIGDIHRALFTFCVACLLNGGLVLAILLLEFRT